MNRVTGKNIKFLVFIAVLAGCAYSLRSQVLVQNTGEIEIPILQKIASRQFGCYIENNFYDKESFRRLATYKDCSFPNLETFKPDFKTQTLIGFHIDGDCDVRATASVFRNDKQKKYEIRIKAIRGGCQSNNGTLQGLLTIKKIRPDYKVDFSEIRADDEISEKDPTDSLFIEKSQLSRPVPLETVSFEMNDCIQTYRQNRFVIKDTETFVKSIRNDMGREKCVNDLEKIDFGKHTLLGIEINSGYCGMPILMYKAEKNPAEKRYILNIDYIAPETPCRALSRYDLWVLVPKLPEDYRVGFEIKAIRQIK